MNKFVVMDLETTGQSPATNDTIIEIGIVIIENNKIIDEYSTLLNPNKPIPPFIANLTGINDEDVVNAPTFAEKAEDMVKLFQDGYLIAHNVPFDLGFLNMELANNGLEKLMNPVIDTVELARILYPQAPSYKLELFADYLNIDHLNPHRALSDAYTTAKVFLKLKEKLESLPYETITHLLNLEKMLKSNVYDLLSNQQHILAFSTTEKDDLISFRGLAFKHIEENEKEKHPLITSFGDYLDDIYEYAGTMEQQMVNYEKRQGQREMSEAVFDAFQSKKHALIEAETGTGKSLAYLIPAIYEAVNKKERIVISTYTTQLQSQLLEEEVPLIKKLIAFPFNVALLKGKHHYISLERFERELTLNQHENYDIALTKAMILVWLTETETGDIDEIKLPSSGYFFFRSISTDSETSIDPYSPWFSKSYYQKARIKAQQADIIITNHALLCTDMFNEYKFLPTYGKAIIDEAHHLEETTSRYYGLKLDYVNMQFSLNRIGTTSDGNWLNKTVLKHSSNQNELPLEQWDETFQQTKYECDDLFRTIFQHVIRQKQHNKSLSDIGRIQYRLEENKKEINSWHTIKEMATRLTFYLRDLIHILSKLDDYFEEEKVNSKFDKDDGRGYILLLQSFIDRIEQFFLIDGSDQQVKWIEIEGYGARNAVYLYSEPIKISTVLANDFFRQKQSIILTSATLTMRNSFSFIENRLGLHSEELLKEKFASPFSYQDQVQLMIPNDFPDINQSNIEEYIFSICEAVLSLAHVTKGRMLVLFTSYDMLKRSHSILKESMDLNEYVLIAQGISSGSRSRLKRNFQTFDQAILLGTSSFWEGVDIPGEALSCIVIARLPFQPPNHPINEAKANYLKKEGKNAFFDLSLPNAVIRFKQGFGRLIRSTNDRGIVFVCDARIIKARYGKFFTKSIPDVPILYDSTHMLIKKAEQWF